MLPMRDVRLLTICDTGGQMRAGGINAADKTNRPVRVCRQM
jgi:hypothetical protein